jgi:hypothetical protein
MDRHLQGRSDFRHGAGLAAWLVRYNTELSHHGYRNVGKRPNDFVNAYLRTVSQEA